MDDDIAARRRRFLISGLAAGASALATRVAQAQTGAAPGGLTVAPASQSGVSPRLTFHGIDTYRGVTAPGLRIELSRLEGNGYRKLGTFTAVAGGRVADPLLVGETYRTGRYEVLVHVGEYFERLGAALPKPAFLSAVPLRFAIHDAGERVHLPVLFSPWSYSYYRGS